MSLTKSQVNNQKRDTRILTLDALKQDIERKIENNKNVDDYEKMIIKETKPTNNKLSADSTKIGSMQTYKVELNTQLSVEVDKKVYALSYPEKITVPKEKYKKGYTYKINDCYYDDDGEFLYRVPGIY